MNRSINEHAKISLWRDRTLAYTLSSKIRETVKYSGKHKVKKEKNVRISRAVFNKLLKES